MRKLNKETNKYGINFPIDEIQFGKYVNFLDVTLYIDEHNQIQYKSYSKPTDAKRYLRPQSFHPKNVFVSVLLFQMMRTIERNSVEETKKVEMKLIRLNHSLIGSRKNLMSFLIRLKLILAVYWTLMCLLVGDLIFSMKLMTK